MSFTTDFTPWSAAAGGALIGLSASLLLLANGRIAGISGILGGLLSPKSGDIAWRLAFAVGLSAAGVAVFLSAPDLIAASDTRSMAATAIAGLLVGFGVRMGNGCTSCRCIIFLCRNSNNSN